MTNDKNLGDRLRELRKARGLSQVEVAAALDVSRSHITQVELGADPGFRVFVDLADFYNVSLDYLYRGASGASLHLAENVAHDEKERILLRIWRLMGEDEKMGLMALLAKAAQSNVA